MVTGNDNAHEFFNVTSNGNVYWKKVTWPISDYSNKNYCGGTKLDRKKIVSYILFALTADTTNAAAYDTTNFLGKLNRLIYMSPGIVTWVSK